MTKSKLFDRYLINSFLPFSLITDDEDDIVQILVPEPNRTPILVHTFRSPQVAGSSEQPNCPEVICLDDLDPVEVVQFSTEEFPQEYRYLLSLPSINDEELKKHMVSSLFCCHAVRFPGPIQSSFQQTNYSQEDHR